MQFVLPSQRGEGMLDETTATMIANKLVSYPLDTQERRTRNTESRDITEGVQIDYSIGQSTIAQVRRSWLAFISKEDLTFEQ
jgi:hypothetical protein